MGYSRAGFTEIVGIDIKPQPRYPFTFVQADVLRPPFDLSYFDAIHASPPCQPYSVLAHLSSAEHRQLVPDVRALLVKTGKPYVIENVPGAPLVNPFRLCGSVFHLETSTKQQLRRHRIFESNVGIHLVPPCNHVGTTIGIFGDKARDTGAEKRHYSRDKNERGQPNGIKISLAEAQRAMGIDWMGFKGLSQAIPPAYTEWIGKQLLQYIQ